MEKICNGIMKKETRGFTLVEQLIVIAIIVSLLGFGAVQMMGVYRQNSIDHAVKNLKTVLQFLQVKAIEDGLIYKLSITEDGKKIRLGRQPRGKKEFEAIHPSWVAGVRMGEGIKIQLERGGEFFFYPDGLATKSRLFVVKENGERIALTLKNRIGTIEVKNV